MFRTIASEGRKFGLGILIVTQRAAKVDKNVLSQCNTQIILKVTNPNDLKLITAVFVFAALVLPSLVKRTRRRAIPVAAR